MSDALQRDTAPLLLLASHGSRDPAAQRAVLALVDAVTRALTTISPATPVAAGFIDVQQPDVPQCLAEADPGRSAVIVPLLVSAGYHVKFDLANAVAQAQPRQVGVTAALGPDSRLTDILADRLAQSGLRAEDRVILAAAGSSDADAVADCRTAGEQLAALLGRPVTVAFIAAATPSLVDAVAAARSESPDARLVVASYLLAPGTFARWSQDAGADVVSATLLVEGEEPPAALVDVVVDRYLSGVRTL
ncbi:MULTISPECIES: sirohydrochlorin chelatase [unclassified Cryobacterium]|uniref:sirohydrochlorin chelatase n=1 Tax=unclassified Cryobacterium TaxID=2649013 RepID=UPI00106A1F93|nr:MULTISPECIES: CbiX/SirB N-terminal domain-containing protein [unclassified Cryobacterium]TFC58717.1 cobalamin biosynthesis protein CbiX [Cryobacterium sp. TMB1-7]TFC89069.1 cobalamin biosynthesis protein CbiX [Cryobacterium sp. TMT4-31]